MQTRKLIPVVVLISRPFPSLPVYESTDAFVQSRFIIRRLVITLHGRLWSFVETSLKLKP